MGGGATAPPGRICPRFVIIVHRISYEAVSGVCCPEGCCGRHLEPTPD